MMGRSRGDDDGAALVEFALVLPLLTLFLFGIVQFGIAYDKQQSTNSAAREGARLAALDDASFEQIADRATGAYEASVSAGELPLVEVFDSNGTRQAHRDADGDYFHLGNPMSASDREDPELMPCGADPPSDFVTVTVSGPFELTIPFFGVRTLTIDASGEFRCE